MKILDCKIDLLKYGVSFTPISMFNSVDAKKYKLKYLNKKPVTDKSQVYDISEQLDMIPAEILLEKDGSRSLTKLRYNSYSPLELRLNNNQLSLYKDGEIVDVKLSLVEYNQVLSEKIPDNISHKGFSIGDYISIVGLNRVTIMLYDGCYNWLCGKNCKFCDLHPVRKEDAVARPTVNDLYKYGKVDKWWDAQREEYIRCLQYSLKRILDSFKDNRECYIFFMAGNLKNNSQTWKICDEVIYELSKVVEFDKYVTYVNIAPHDTLENLKKIKSYGIKNVQYNLEVSNKDIFTDYCPGKMNYDEFLQKLIEATSVMGKGNVRSNFVLGLEPMDSLLSFADKVAKAGVVVDYSVFQPKKGTQLYTHPSPKFEDVVEFSNGLNKIYKKYGQKPIFSTVSSRSSVMNELFLEI